MEQPNLVLPVANRILTRFPSLQFIALGVLLYLVMGLFTPEEPLPPLPQPTEVQVREMHNNWLRRSYKPPTDEEMAVLIRDWVDLEVLFQESLRLKLYLTDTLVWRRLIRNLQFVGVEGDDAQLLQYAFRIGMHAVDPVVRKRMLQLMEDRVRVRLPPPSEEWLEQAYAEEQSSEFITQRRAFSHIFFSYDRRGETGARRAAERFSCRGALDRSAAGDNFPAAKRVTPLLTENQIAKNFGVAFARKVMEFEINRCYGPLDSAYGVHWVYVHDHQSEKMPYQRARRLLVEDFLRQQTIQGLRIEAERLRERYQAL